MNLTQRKCKKKKRYVKRQDNEIMVVTLQRPLSLMFSFQSWGTTDSSQLAKFLPIMLKTLKSTMMAKDVQNCLIPSQSLDLSLPSIIFFKLGNSHSCWGWGNLLHILWYIHISTYPAGMFFL